MDEMKIIAMMKVMFGNKLAEISKEIAELKENGGTGGTSITVDEEEILLMLLQEDALPVVQDADGAILVDSDGAIILG